jgi:hypothetical protein
MVLLTLEPASLAPFDDEPFIGFSALETNQVEATDGLSGMHRENNLLIDPLLPVVGSLVPDAHNSSAVLAFGKDPLEVPECQVMILDLNREPLDTGLLGQSFWDGPAFENAVFFQPEIVVMGAGVVFLDNKAEVPLLAGARWNLHCGVLEVLAAR